MRLNKLARPERFELPTNWFEASYSIQLSYGRFSVRVNDGTPAAESVILHPSDPEHRAIWGYVMKKLSCLLLLAATLSSPAWADCAYPRAPGKAPDGNTAKREEMVAAKKLVDQYNVDMNAYLACIKTEYDGSVAKQAASLTEEQKQQMALRFTQKNDAAVDELQDVAGRFNEQLRAFRAKSAK